MVVTGSAMAWIVYLWAASLIVTDPAPAGGADRTD
jgi:hypothetical protein